MRESISVRENAGPIPIAREPIAARREAPLVRGRECQLGVRYYRRMRLQRIYSLVVEGPREGARHAGLLSVRPLIPGATVTPLEQDLDATRPGARTEFAVTPLARGRLRAAQIEVRSHGRLAQTIPLGMRATAQRLTWLLLALTFLVPLFLRNATTYHPLSGQKYLDTQKFRPAANAPARAGNAAPAPEGKNEEQQADDDPKKDGGKKDGADSKKDGDAKPDAAKKSEPDKAAEPAKDAPRPGG